MAWIDERPNAYPENFLPPHTDQFYATDIPMYYDDDRLHKSRFDMNRALSKKDILKQSSSYPYLDTSEVTFADIPEEYGAWYEPDKNLSSLNLKYTNPQDINKWDLKNIGHETMHQTFDKEHGIPAAHDVLKGSIEPFDDYSSWKQEGPKRATDYNPSYNRPEDRLKSEHLLIKAIQNMDNPEFDASKLDDSLYQGYWSNYHNALLDEVSEEGTSYFPGDDGHYYYYEPKNAFLGNAPGEVRRGYFGLRGLFDQSALKYKDILKNYGNRGRLGPGMGQQRPLDEGLGDAGIAERIAAQDRAKKNAAIQEAVNIQIGTSRGGDDKPSRPSRRDRGRARRRGETGQIAGGHHFSRGGLMDIPLPGRSRDI